MSFVYRNQVHVGIVASSRQVVLAVSFNHLISDRSIKNPYNDNLLTTITTFFSSSCSATVAFAFLMIFIHHPLARYFQTSPKRAFSKCQDNPIIERRPGDSISVNPELVSTSLSPLWHAISSSPYLFLWTEWCSYRERTFPHSHRSR